MNRRTYPIAAVAGITLLLSSITAQAAIRYVALDGSGANGQSWAAAYTSIQEAIDDFAVTAGDEIWVKQGTYAIGAAINVSKAVKIYGGYSGSGDTRDWEVYTTTIDASSGYFHSFSVTTDARVDGFTIRDGQAYGSGSANKGGGMYIGECSATVANCTFTNNYASITGGALFIDNADAASVSNCVFTGNSSAGVGGGIHNYYSDATITGCTFQANATGLSAEGDQDRLGGGIYNDHCSPHISDCTFSDNVAKYGAGICNYQSGAVIEDCVFAGCDDATMGGGGIYNYGGSNTIRRSLFYGNEVTHRGGAILDQSTSTIIHCMMWGNSSTAGGGAIAIDMSTGEATSRAEFINCTIYGNHAYQGGGLYSDYASALLMNCIVWGNTAEGNGPGIHNVNFYYLIETEAYYCDIQGDSTYPGTGNLRADPCFVDAGSHDFHLRPGSACIDGGTNTVSALPSVDYEGSPRIVDGDEDGEATVDMGVYEYQGDPTSDRLYGGEILQAVVYDDPNDTTASYVFSLLLGSDSTVDHIRFVAPGGTSGLIPNDAHTTSGDVETRHEVRDNMHLWEYRAVSSNPASLANYGDGTYKMRIYYTDGSNRLTHFVYGVAGTSTPIEQPTQRPNVADPAYEASLGSPLDVSWWVRTDPTVNLILLTIAHQDTGETVVDEVFHFTRTTSDQYTLAEGWYDVEVGFANWHQGQNDDGTQFEYGKAVIVGHQFEVLHTLVYRFWSPRTERHFYTISARERDKLVDDYPHTWTYEGPVFKACATDYHAGLVPVYRFWSDRSRGHFYTTSETERDKLIDQYANVWAYEGVAFYAYPEETRPPESRAVYRFWKAEDNTHFYTADETEGYKLVSEYSHVYAYEGIAFYAYE